MMEGLKPLEQINMKDSVLFGGKAAVLGTAIHHGFSVSEGLCLSRTLFDAWLISNGHSRKVVDEMALADEYDQALWGELYSKMQTVLQGEQARQWITRLVAESELKDFLKRFAPVV